MKDTIGLEQKIRKFIICNKPEKGMRDAKIMMARNLLKNGVSLELIIDSTGLSREELISLQ